MSKARGHGVFVNSQLGKRVSRKVMWGAEHLVIEGGGSIIGNTVMNGIYYPLEEVKKLASDVTGFVHAPNAHPYDDNGGFISAGSPEAVSKFYFGGVAYNYRMSGDRLVRDIAINIEVASRTEAGRELIARIEAGDDVDTSTGLLYKPEVASGIGLDGEPYDSVARNMMLDHDAILLREQGAATSDQGVGLFANSKGEDEEVDIMVTAVNASMPALRLEVVDIEWDEAGAIQRIKEYTGSTDAPSTNYRRYFLEFDRDNVDSFDAYRKPFADILDGKPVAVKAAVEQYAKEELDGRAAMAVKVYATNSLADDAVKEPGSMKKLFTKFMEWFAINRDREYNADANDITTNEEDAMKEMINAYLKEKGINTEGMTDEQALNAYMKAKNEEASATEDSKPAANSNEDTAANAQLLAAVNALADQVKELKTAQNASKDAELTALAADVEALEIGLNAAQAKALGAEGMKALIAKNGGHVNFAANGQRFTGNSDKVDDGCSDFLAS